MGTMITNGTTSWPLDENQYSGTGTGNILVKATTSVGGISGFVSAPAISGESAFYVGYSQAAGAVTLYQLDKDDLGGFTGGVQNAVGGVIYSAPIRVGVDWSDHYMPTPVVSGGSIFVVCNNGGVTVYDTQDLEFQGGRTLGYVGEILLGANAQTGVTASPVVYETNSDGSARTDPYIIMCGSSAVSCYLISDGLSGNSRQWWYNYANKAGGADDTIWGTPAVSNNYVYVPVWSTADNTGWIDVFNITGRASLANDEQAPTATHRLNGPAVASPIVVNRDMFTLAFGTAGNPARAYKFDESTRLTDERYAHAYWTQFKFDAAKTGENTVVEEEDYVPGSSGGCFISTIK
jgi:hypothetical protein